MNEYIDNNFSSNLTKCINLLNGDLDNCSPKHACFVLIDKKRYFDLDYSSCSFWGHTSPWEIKAKFFDTEKIKPDTTNTAKYLNSMIRSNKNISLHNSELLNSITTNKFVVDRNLYYQEGYENLNKKIQSLPRDTILIESGLIGLSSSLNVFDSDNIQTHYIVDAIENLILLSKESSVKDCSNLSNMQIRFLMETSFFSEKGRFEILTKFINNFAKEMGIKTLGPLMIEIPEIDPESFKNHSLLVSAYKKGSLLEFPFCITNAQIGEILNRVRTCLS